MDSPPKSAFDDFPQLALRFCEVVESAPRLDRDAFLQQLAVSLARLYGVALDLPFVEPATTEVGEASTQHWSAVWPMLKEKLGDLDSYWQVFDPGDKEEVIQMGVSQDIAEIYQDLKEGLAFAESSAHPDDIHWTWREDFRHHWGRHAVNALRSIHHLLCEP